MLISILCHYHLQEEAWYSRSPIKLLERLGNYIIFVVINFFWPAKGIFTPLCAHTTPPNRILSLLHPFPKSFPNPKYSPSSPNCTPKPPTYSPKRRRACQVLSEASLQDTASLRNIPTIIRRNSRYRKYSSRHSKHTSKHSKHSSKLSNYSSHFPTILPSQLLFQVIFPKYTKSHYDHLQYWH